jgi:protein-glutamine gamma-glutamyltransferase
MKGVPHPLSPEVRLASTRDLVLLVASLLLVILPHAQRAPWWLTLLTLCLYIWRIHYSLNPAPLPSRWLVYGFAVVAMLGVWMEFRTIFGDAGLASIFNSVAAAANAAGADVKL